jgi:hypothetical protein
MVMGGTKNSLKAAVTRGEGMGEKLCTEMTILTPRGQVKDAEVCIALAKSDTGEVKTYAYIRDITARKKFERDLKDLPYKVLGEVIPDGLEIQYNGTHFKINNDRVAPALSTFTRIMLIIFFVSSISILYAGFLF